RGLPAAPRRPYRKSPGRPERNWPRIGTIGTTGPIGTTGTTGRIGTTGTIGTIGITASPDAGGLQAPAARHPRLPRRNPRERCVSRRASWHWMWHRTTVRRGPARHQIREWHIRAARRVARALQRGARLGGRTGHLPARGRYPRLRAASVAASLLLGSRTCPI